jgi:putative endonuclease
LKRREVGRTGERLATEYLVREGYAVRARNWRSPGGEIDIIAEKNGQLVMIEVKTRRSRRFGSGEESVTARKLANLERCGVAYLEAQALLDRSWQIDVIAVDLSPQGELLRLHHLPDVLQR